jgi:hypothetical protein
MVAHGASPIYELTHEHVAAAVGAV